MADKPKDHVYVEEGELRKMRDPRTGQIKEVDLSLPALSRTMENIRKSAEIINQPNVSFDMAMGRFEYIKELVLDSAQFSIIYICTIKSKEIRSHFFGRSILMMIGIPPFIPPYILVVSRSVIRMILYIA